MKINSESALAICRLLATIVAAIAATFGWSFDVDIFFNIVVSIVALALLIYTWWKNANLTFAAQQAQKVLDAIKRKQAEDDEEIKYLQALAAEKEVINKEGTE